MSPARGSGWLAGPGYYFRSTVCFLLAPMTSFKILQRRLTVIDLSLEPRLRTQYELLKLIFRIATEAMVTMPSDEDIALLDWRGASDQAGDAVVREPVTVAHGYLQNRIAG